MGGKSLTYYFLGEGGRGGNIDGTGNGQTIWVLGKGKGRTILAKIK